MGVWYRLLMTNKDVMITNLLSQVFRPKTQANSPHMIESKSRVKTPIRYSPERIFKQSLNPKHAAKGQKRTLIENKFSVADLNIKKRWVGFINFLHTKFWLCYWYEMVLKLTNLNFMEKIKYFWHRFDKIMQNQQQFELYLSNSRSRCRKQPKNKLISKDLTSKTAAYTGFKTKDANSTQKSGKFQLFPITALRRNAFVILT